MPVIMTVVKTHTNTFAFVRVTYFRMDVMSVCFKYTLAKRSKEICYVPHNLCINV